MTETRKTGAAQDAMADDWAAALEEQEGATVGGDNGATNDGAPADAAGQDDGRGARKARFDSFAEDAGAGDEPAPAQGSPAQAADVNLEVVLDIPVTISMEIGRSRVSIRNLLQLNQGSVIELDRLAGEPLDVFANGTLIAHGEVVVVNEKFGIRLTDVMSPTERVQKLK